jgi:hypothetical protein
MPFASRYNPVYDAVKLVCSKKGLSCERVDEKALTEPIAITFFKVLYDCGFIIADLSELRPSVLYELGVAHVFMKPTILLAVDGTSLPFYQAHNTLHLYLLESKLRFKEKNEPFQKGLGRLIDDAHSRRASRNCVTDALGCGEDLEGGLLKYSWKWLFSYRRSLEREKTAKEVWVFARDLYWEDCGGPSYERAINEAILKGERSYKVLLADSKKNEKDAKEYFDRLRLQAQGDEALSTLLSNLQIRFDKGDLIESLPCSIVLFDPLEGRRIGILCEPMLERPGGDSSELGLNDRPIEDRPPHHWLRARYADIQMNSLTTQRYQRLFSERFKRARKPDWLNG